MQTYVKRNVALKISDHMKNFPAVALLGPRQSGKSTMAKRYIESIPNSVYLDLEDPVDFSKLTDPSAFLAANANKLICFDEIQRYPEIFPIFRSHLDRGNRPGQLLLLGSASRDLIRQSSESLAGRISYLNVTPFLANEVDDINRLWLQGGFPQSYLKSDEFSNEWRTNYIRTFLERDIPNLGIRIPAATLRRFWQMLAHSNGQLLNMSKLASSMGTSSTTIKSYIDILEGTFIIRQLSPFSANTKKRLVKSPKIYVSDTGLLHCLLGIESFNDLLGHPVLGSSFESMALTSIIENMPKYTPSFYRSSSGAEIDLVLEKGNKKICIEIKASTTPKLTQGFYEGLKVVNPDHVFVLANINDSYPVNEGIEAMGIMKLLDVLGKLA
jgi:predicted AAA+ superfamily ATPase